MVMKNNTSIKKVGGFLLGFGGLMAAASPTFAVDLDYGMNEEFFSINYNGYVRTTVGVLLQDSKETAADDKWRMSQARATVNIDWDIKTGPLNWRVVTRVEHEHKTDYLEDLSERMDKQHAVLNGALPGLDNRGTYGRYGTEGSFMDQYETTDEIMDIVREIYFDWQITDNLFARIGRQQLVWGESDFFQAMDVVHGYDFRQRLFYENNEEWRKPLFLLNFVYEVHDWDGMFNFYLRPGLDRAVDMGSNYNIEGGRWIPTPYRGVDFTQVTDAYNEDHNKGDWDDWTYGIRWNGRWGSAGYSFSYMKTFNPQPVINPNLNLNAGGTLAGFGEYYGVGDSVNTSGFRSIGNPGDPSNPANFNMPVDKAMEGYGDGYRGDKLLGEWLYPEIDVFGFTVNYFSMAMDSTLSAEVAFIPNKPYNFGQLQSDLPGWGGIKEKDTLNVMLRIDKEFKWQQILGTHRPSLSSIQLFDTWIINRKKDDEIVEFASFGEEKSEHTVYLTLFTLLNYTRDTINPSLVVGTDLTNGGGFVIPAVEFVWGNDWRLKVEADLWWNDGDRKKVCGKAENNASEPSAVGDLGVSGCSKAVGDDLLGVRENNASFMDWFARDNQLVFKLTRQF